jgi:hypothetical protein
MALGVSAALNTAHEELASRGYVPARSSFPMGGLRRNGPSYRSICHTRFAPPTCASFSTSYLKSHLIQTIPERLVALRDG